jgi:hypothetical protein
VGKRRGLGDKSLKRKLDEELARSILAQPMPKWYWKRLEDPSHPEHERMVKARPRLIDIRDGKIEG